MKVILLLLGVVACCGCERSTGQTPANDQEPSLRKESVSPNQTSSRAVNLIGDWAGHFNGIPETPDEELALQVVVDMRLKLAADGTYISSAIGAPEMTAEGTYRIDGDTLTLQPLKWPKTLGANGDPQPLRIVGDSLRFVSERALDTKLSFRKLPAQPR